MNKKLLSLLLALAMTFSLAAPAMAAEEETEAPLFDGYYDLCIPPGRVGRASEVLMVKDGVTAVQASYYPGYSDEKLILDIDLS